MNYSHIIYAYDEDHKCLKAGRFIEENDAIFFLEKIDRLCYALVYSVETGKIRKFEFSKEIKMIEYHDE